VLDEWLESQCNGFKWETQVFSCSTRVGEMPIVKYRNSSLSSFPDILFAGIVPGLYAMVGAAAALSGVTVSFFFFFYIVIVVFDPSSFTKTAHNSLIGCHYVRTHRHSDLCCACYAFGSRCKDNCRCFRAKRNIWSCNRVEPAAIPWLEARVSVGEPPNKWCGEFFSASKDPTSNFF